MIQFCASSLIFRGVLDKGLLQLAKGAPVELAQEFSA